MISNLPHNALGSYGYWTSNAVGGINDHAIIIKYTGDIYASTVEDQGIGIRPVITIPNSILYTE